MAGGIIDAYPLTCDPPSFPTPERKMCSRLLMASGYVLQVSRDWQLRMAAEEGGGLDIETPETPLICLMRYGRHPLCSPELNWAQRSLLCRSGKR